VHYYIDVVSGYVSVPLRLRKVFCFWSLFTFFMFKNVVYSFDPGETRVTGRLNSLNTRPIFNLRKN